MRLFSGRNKSLFSGSLLGNKNLFSGSLPGNKNSFSGSLPVNRSLFSGSRPVNRSLFTGSLQVNRSLFSGSGEIGYVAKSTHDQAKGGADATQQEFVSIALSKAWAHPVQWSCIYIYSTSELLGSAGSIGKISEPDNEF
jgi:hypothetical protein